MTMNLLAKKTTNQAFTVSEQVVYEFERARYSIWIANIWFTDTAIYNLLMKKLREGINVEVILSAGKFMSCDENARIRKFIQAGGEFFPIRETEENKLCSSGFCMVDYSTVIDNGFTDKSYLQSGYSAYFIREYPEALVEHYFNEYFSIKNNFCVNRYS
ncbi:MAG: phospholipase D-like domain-containing protein [Bacteroidales bacterium]